MAFRRKRRKPSVFWTPNLNATNPTGVEGKTCNLQDTITVLPAGAIGGGGTITTSIYGLTTDVDPEVVQVTTMASYEGGAWRLRRIVGKLFIEMRQGAGNEGNTDTPSALVSAGFIVLRTDENGAPLKASSPNHYSPLAHPNERDPWIWQRSWIVNNGLARGLGSHALNNVASAFEDGPWSNYELGTGVADGPNLNQKTNRRISAQERLFFVISTQCPSGGSYDETGFVDFILQYRLLGSPLRVLGNRNNASR